MTKALTIKTDSAPTTTDIMADFGRFLRLHQRTATRARRRLQRMI